MAQIPPLLPPEEIDLAIIYLTSHNCCRNYVRKYYSSYSTFITFLIRNKNPCLTWTGQSNVVSSGLGFSCAWQFAWNIFIINMAYRTYGGCFSVIGIYRCTREKNSHITNESWHACKISFLLNWTTQDGEKKIQLTFVSHGMVSSQWLFTLVG